MSYLPLVDGPGGRSRPPVRRHSIRRVVSEDLETAHRAESRRSAIRLYTGGKPPTLTFSDRFPPGYSTADDVRGCFCFLFFLCHTLTVREVRTPPRPWSRGGPVARSEQRPDERQSKQRRSDDRDGQLRVVAGPRRQAQAQPQHVAFGRERPAGQVQHVQDERQELAEQSQHRLQLARRQVSELHGRTKKIRRSTGLANVV